MLSKIKTSEQFFAFLRKILKFFLFLSVLGLHCCAQAFTSVASGGYSLVAVLGLFIAMTLLVAEYRL